MLLPSCSQFAVLYDAWKLSTQNCERLMGEYIISPSEELLKDIRESQKDIQKAREEFLRVLHEPIPFQKEVLVRFEAEVMENLLAQGRDIAYAVTDGYVSGLTYASADRLKHHDPSLSPLREVPMYYALKLFTKLKALSCEKAPVKNLSILPATLTSLNWSESGNIEKITYLPPGLEMLRCHRCTQLESIPPLPHSLSQLNCAGAESLVDLPPLPQGITSLICSGCKLLTTLPEIPQSTATLVCNGCPLSVLPVISHTYLTYLGCSSCKNLTELPAFPDTLVRLVCDRIPITVFPPFPKKMTRINCVECKNLTTIPPLPDLLEYIDCSGCPNLSEETRTMLDAHAKKHPSCVIKYTGSDMNNPKEDSGSVLKKGATWIKNIFK